MENFMTAGFFGFLIFIHTEPTALNNLAVQPYHGEKRSPTAKTFTNALAHLQSSRSALWSHRILTILWRTVGMRSSIQQKS